MWWAGKAGGAPAGGGVFSTERRAPSPAPLARPLPLAGEVLPPSLTLSAAARMPDRTSPASTEGSWSGSPRRTRRAPSGTASTSLAISGRSIIEASSTTTTSNGSGLSAWCRNRGLSGMVPSRRCRVVPVVGRWSSRAWSMPRAGSAWMAGRTLSGMRSAARPVGGGRAVGGGGWGVGVGGVVGEGGECLDVGADGVGLAVGGAAGGGVQGYAGGRVAGVPCLWDQEDQHAGDGGGLAGAGAAVDEEEGVVEGGLGGLGLGGLLGGSKIKVKIKGALIRPSGTFSRRREKGLLRGGFGFARGVRGLGWVGRGLGAELGEEWGLGQMGRAHV